MTTTFAHRPIPSVSGTIADKVIQWMSRELGVMVNPDPAFREGLERVIARNLPSARKPVSPDPERRFCDLQEQYIEDNAGDIASDFADADSDEKLLKAARHLRESMVEYAKEHVVPFHMR